MTLEIGGNAATQLQKDGILSELGAAKSGDVSRLTQAVNEPLGIRTEWDANDAPILIVLGQSNSYGHNTTLAAAEQVMTGYANVLTLDRSANGGALYSTEVGDSRIAWTGMTTLGKHNIATPAGDTAGAQDHACNAANQFAKLWQAHITAGNALKLPNLYVILYGRGSQGLALGNSVGDCWSPDRSEADVGSLYPRFLKTIRAAIRNLIASGKNPRIIAVHWNQWETEAASTAAVANASLINFNRIIAGVNDAIGTQQVPWRFFYPLATVYPAANIAIVRRALEKVVSQDTRHRSFLDLRTSAHYTGVSPGFGVFTPDNVHYSVTTQKWFAEQEWANIQAGRNGVAVASNLGHMDAYWLDKRIAKAENAYSPTSWYPWTRPLGSYLDASSKVPGWTFIETSAVATHRVRVERVGGKKSFKVSTVTKGGTGGQALMIAASTPQDAVYGGFEFGQFCNPFPEITVCLLARATSEAGTYSNLGYGYLAVQLSGAYTNKPQFMPGPVVKGATPAQATPYCIVWNLQANNHIRSMDFTGTPSNGVYAGAPALGANYGGAPLVTGWPTNAWSRWRVGLTAANNGTLSVEWYDTTTSTWKVAIQQQNMNPLLTGNLASGQLGLMFGMSATTNTVAEHDSLLTVPFKDVVFTSED